MEWILYWAIGFTCGMWFTYGVQEFALWNERRRNFKKLMDAGTYNNKEKDDGH